MQKILLLLCSVLLSLFLFVLVSEDSSLHRKSKPIFKSTSSPKASQRSKQGRDEYFLNMLRDPKTGKIPPSIRTRELKFAKSLRAASLKKSDLAAVNDWQEAGPFDVGGRTRALAIDLNNSDVIMAGGVSGGIWKSTDKGNTWRLKNFTYHNLSVTAVVQDPRPGFRNNWYYVSGETDGNSAAGYNSESFTGDGIYKSTDNGETWNVLPSTISTLFFVILISL